ncbi:15564_t:CDS:1 [Gigaspora margarita]|uniref:15564_t:CDS:1 n=1 Tax=Gigaspora margarita TaxID=4874 RepID=A0ABN7VIN8_GIGMA|nr:15564_t:CDS:1 [Gigaspora margarita]
MTKSWHELLISLDSYHQTAICRNNKSWLVREILYPFQVLDLHQTLIPINIKNNTSNSNTGYYKYLLIKNADTIWIPLLSGYTIYTKFNNKFFKLSIWKNLQQNLIFFWWMYDNEIFKIFQDNGCDNEIFRSLFVKYKPSNNQSISWLLGFCNNANLQYIQLIILQQYPNPFEIDKKLTKTLHKETLLKNNLDRLSSVLKDHIKNQN